MGDPGIVRNRAKIEAARRNARAAQQVPEGLSQLLWSFAPPPRPNPATLAEVPAVTPESTAMAKELKRRGFAFVGPTTAYALMQATGMVDDHVASCFRAGATHLRVRGSCWSSTRHAGEWGQLWFSNDEQPHRTPTTGARAAR